MRTILFLTRTGETAGMLLFDAADGAIMRHANENADYASAFLVTREGFTPLDSGNVDANGAIDAAQRLIADWGC
jgi:hypothetical protein